MRCCILGALLTGLACGLVGVRAESEEVRRITRQLKQIKESEPTAWKRIPWVASIREAQRLSAKEQCPVFLFSHDGNIETGRC
jgi:hypothetical protein